MFNVYFFFQNNNDTIYYSKWSVWSSLPFSPKWPSFMNNQEKAKIVIPLWKFLNLKDAKKWSSVCGWKCGNKGAKNYFQFIADNSQLCFTPLFGFEMVRCAFWFSYWWYSFLWEASRCPGCSWRPWDKFFRTNKIKDMWIIYAIFYKNNYNCHWRAFCT